MPFSCQLQWKVVYGVSCFIIEVISQFSSAQRSSMLNKTVLDWNSLCITVHLKLTDKVISPVALKGKPTTD